MCNVYVFILCVFVLVVVCILVVRMYFLCLFGVICVDFAMDLTFVKIINLFYDFV